MLIINKKDIEIVFTMRDAIEADKEALRMYTEGNTKVPLRTNIQTDKGQNLYMPAYAPEISASGVKIVSIFPDNPKLEKPTTIAQVLMLDGETGEVSAMIDGTYLTQLRTGAMQGAATELLSRKESKKAVLIGAGGQAESQLQAMITVRDLEEVAIIDLNKELANKFAETMNKKHEDVKIYVPEDSDKAISEADIITAVTTAPGAVFDGGLIKKGCHVNGMGSYTKDMKEIPSQVFEQADVMVVDTFDAVFAEAGDVMQVLKDGTVKEEDFIELGQLVLDPKLGRQSDDQITVFNSVGSAILDVVVAARILEKAESANIGNNVEI